MERQQEQRPVLIEAFADEIAPQFLVHMSDLSSESSEDEASYDEDDSDDDRKMPALPSSRMISERSFENENQFQNRERDGFLSTNYSRMSTSNVAISASVAKASSSTTTTKGTRSIQNKFPGAPKRRDPRLCDHTYRDLSQIQADMKYADMIEDREGEFGFIIKLHEILENFAKYVDWLPHGRSFRIVVPKRLETNVFPTYFNHNRLHTFMKQLINWGFKHITRGRDRNSYYHEAFLKGLPHLCRFMTYKVRSKPRPDPENEPCFYKIHSIAPLPIFAPRRDDQETPADPSISNSFRLLHQPDLYSDSKLSSSGTRSSDLQLALLESLNSYRNQSSFQGRSLSTRTAGSLLKSVYTSSSAAATTRRLSMRRPTESNLDSLQTAALAAVSESSSCSGQESLAAMAFRFSMETNRMSHEELRVSLKINLLQQQQLLLAHHRLADVSVQDPALQQHQRQQARDSPRLG